MENERYMREGLDLKKIILLFMNKLWIAAAAVIAGAILGTLIYFIAGVVFAPEREYQSVSKVYLNFNCEPEDFNELAYNGYTWNDLMATDPILNYTMQELPERISRDAVIEATKAEILSDIRLLTITITTDRPEVTAQIMSATQASLIHLGKTDELFHSIQIYSTTGPERIVWDDRTVSAAVTGAVIALFASLMAMSFAYILEDSVYVEADAEKRYGLPVFGIFTANEPGTFQSYGNEFLSNYLYLCKDTMVSLVSIDCMGDAEKAKQTMEKILSTARPKGGKNVLGTYENIPMEMPEDAPEIYEDIRKTGGVIVIMRYGRGNGKRMERALSNLKTQDCKVLGILIVEADEKFLKRYYMCKKDRSRK